ncbi:MAG TPA: transposase [Lacunisphaera sp.]|nr:transposase [Lacunisphaera sp.]
MKTQITKPVAGRTPYSEEYKQQAVEKWQSSGRSAAKVGAELGIRPALLFRWAKAQRDRKTGQAARGARSLEEIEAENARLREENAKLLEQREILKKSLGILSEPPRRGMPTSKP